MRTLLKLALVVGAVSGTCASQVRAQSKELLARDINGYSLGMTISQVEALAHKPLKQLSSQDFEVDSDGVHYDFEFSVLGHLYRITSDQAIGYFTPDDAYCKTLATRMSKKYGIPNAYQFVCQIQWASVEAYPASTGPLNRYAMELSARTVEENEKPVSLEIFMIDRRIARRDVAKANETPSSKAADETKF